MFRNMYPNQILIFSQVWIFSLPIPQFLSAGAMSNPFLRPPLSPWAPRLFAHVEYKDDAPVVKYTIKRDTYRISTANPWYLTNRTMENHGKFVTFSTWIHLHLGFSMVNIRTWNQRMTKFAPSVVTQVYRGHCGYHSPFCRSLLDFGIEFFRQTKLLVGSHISMVGPGRHTHLYSPVAAIPSGKLT